MLMLMSYFFTTKLNDNKTGIEKYPNYDLGLIYYINSYFVESKKNGLKTCKS